MKNTEKVLSIFYSLRFRLTLLVLIAIVPLLGLTLYTTSVQRQYAAAQAKNNSLVMANLIAKDYEEVVDSGRQLLIALARVPDILNSQEDPETCSSFLAEVSAQYPVYSNLVVAAPNGDLICSALPSSGAVNYSDRDWFQDAMQGRGFTVGEIVIGYVTKAPILPLAYPILDSEGDVKLIVTAAADLAWLNQMSSNAQLPEDSVTMVLDHKGTVITRHPDPEGWTGKVMTEAPIVETILTRRQGTADAGGLDGTQRLYAFVPLGSLSENEGYVAIGIPTQVVYAEVNRILAYELIGLGLVTVLAFAATWLVGDVSIMRRVRTLLHATRRLADGDLSARTSITQPKGELSQLAFAFDRMAESLKQRELEQKQVVEAVESLARFPSENPNPVLRVQKDGKIIYANAASGDLLADWDCAVGGYLPSEWCAMVSELAASNEKKMVDVTCRGRIYAILLVPIRDADYVNLYGRDITERKRVEKALRESEERFRTVFEKATVGIYQTTPDGRVLMANPALVKLLGYDTFEDLAQRNLEEEGFEPEYPRSEFRQHIEREGEIRGFESAWRKRDGTTIYIRESAKAMCDDSGKVLYYEGSVEDITERKQAEVALRQAEAKYRALVEQIPAIIYTDSAVQVGQTFYISPQLEEILGYKPEEWLADNDLWLKIMHPDDRDRASSEYVRANETGEPFNAEYRVVTPDGRIVWMRDQATLVRDQSGQPLFWQGIMLDITQRKQAEEEIHRLNAELEQRVRDRTAQLEAVNKELEAFAYSVSHDLRAPLRAMDGFSAALSANYPDKLDEQGQHYLGRIRDASQRMGQLINDLLDLSRVTRRELDRQRVDLSALAEEIAAELQRREPQRQAEFAIAPQMVAEADPHLLRSVMQNLLDNAWKFTALRPQARIEVGFLPYSHPSVPSPSPAGRGGRSGGAGVGGEVVYFVRDNGVGFDMAYADKLFTPFQRLHGMQEFPGTGIGLATVQRIVVRHGGRVWVEAAVDQGATFYFTLGGTYA